MKKILFLILPLLLLTGCYNYRELNELAIATAVEIDKIEDEFHLLVQVANPKNQNDASSANQPQFVTYEGKGKTIQEAFRNIINESSRKIYGMHIQLLIITENIAKNDLDSMLDFFFRNTEIRKEFYVILDTTKTEDDKLLKIQTPITNLSSQSILNSLETNSKYMGVSNLLTFNDLMDIYLDDNKELVLPTVHIQGNTNEGETQENLKTTDSNTTISLGNMAIFKNEKLLGYLTKEQSIAINILKNEIKDALITHECDTNKFETEEITLDKTEINLDIKKKKVTINIKGSGYIAEYGCSANLKDEKTINKIKKNLNTYIEKEMLNAITSINSTYNSDIYNFKDIIYKQDPEYFNKIKDNYYKDIFNKLKYEVKSNIELQGKGNIVGGTYENKKN